MIDEAKNVYLGDLYDDIKGIRSSFYKLFNNLDDYNGEFGEEDLNIFRNEIAEVDELLHHIQLMIVIILKGSDNNEKS